MHGCRGARSTRRWTGWRWPTNGLDPVGMAETRELIRRLGSEGKAILLSSHQLGEVQQICDRVGVIFKGRLVTESTVEELRGATGLALLATPLNRAESCLVELLGRERVSAQGEELRLDVGNPPDPRGLSRRELMKAGVDVYELRRDERSLEDVFLAMSAAYHQEGGGQDGA